MSTTRPSLKAYLALAAVCVIWGTTYLGLRIGVTQFPPFLFSFLRFISAGTLLAGFMLTVGKVPWPSREVLFNQSLCGLLMVTLGISVVGWAEVYISSGLAAIICSCMPIWALLINVLIIKDEQPNWIIILGLAAGITGIVIIFGEHINEFTQTNYTQAIVATFLANLSWAAGSIWIKKKSGHGNPFLNAGLQMLAGAVFLVPLTLLFDDYSRVQWSASLLYTLAYMSLIGSVAAYACYSYAIKHLPMTIVSMYAYINPVVAVILGWLILDEKLNTLIAIAIVLTLSGIYLVNLGYQRKSRSATARAAS
jgi:drug/metabolite transporter (DMT)-like permease